jgi:hypothetical protein
VCGTISLQQKARSYPSYPLVLYIRIWFSQSLNIEAQQCVVSGGWVATSCGLVAAPFVSCCWCSCCLVYVQPCAVRRASSQSAMPNMTHYLISTIPQQASTGDTTHRCLTAHTGSSRPTAARRAPTTGRASPATLYMRHNVPSPSCSSRSTDCGAACPHLSPISLILSCWSYHLMN